MSDFVLCAHEITEKPLLVRRDLHSHDNFEIYALLEGNADYLVEGSRYALSPGDLLLMRKGEVHMFRLRSDAPYRRMHVNFDIPSALSFFGRRDLLTPFTDRPLGKWNHYPASLFPEKEAFRALDRLCRAPARDRLFYLLPLLSLLQNSFETVKARQEGQAGSAVDPILAYLNAHLSEDIALTDLCRRFFISPAHLNRLFRAATGTTVWQYVIIKRLFLAKEALDAGEKPTRVFSRCGFKDYATFYRAYRKHFGAAPTKG